MSDPQAGLPRQTGLLALGGLLVAVPVLAFVATSVAEARRSPVAVETITEVWVPPAVLAALAATSDPPDVIVTTAPAGPDLTPEPPTDAPTDQAGATGEPGRRGREALALVPFDWESRLPSWRIEFGPSRSDAVGFTWSRERRIEIFVPDDATTSFLAHVIAHELGHAVDVELNSPDDRLRWQRARSITDTPWWAASGSSDFASGAGDFAESFAAWLVGPEWFASKLGPPPRSDQLALLAGFAEG